MNRVWDNGAFILRSLGDNHFFYSPLFFKLVRQKLSLKQSCNVWVSVSRHSVTSPLSSILSKYEVYSKFYPPFYWIKLVLLDHESV